MQVISNLAKWIHEAVFHGRTDVFRLGDHDYSNSRMSDDGSQCDHKADRRRQGGKVLYEDHREQAVPVFISACHRNDLCRQPDGIYVWKICRRKV